MKQHENAQFCHLSQYLSMLLRTTRARGACLLTFFLLSKRNLYGSMPYATVLPMTGKMWKTVGGSCFGLGMSYRDGRSSVVIVRILALRSWAASCRIAESVRADARR